MDRISITVDAELGRAIREAATASGMSLSSWAAEALAERVRQHNMRAFLDDWQAEQGEFTEQELAAADKIIADAEAEMKARAAQRVAG